MLEICVIKLHVHRAAEADRIVIEFMQFGGKGVFQLMVLLSNRVRNNEYAPSRWKGGVVVNLFQTGYTTHPRNHRVITLMNAVGTVFGMIS